MIPLLFGGGIGCRTDDCKRLLCGTLHFLLPGGGHPHMNRRAFISLLGGAASWPLAARAQKSTGRPLVGLLTRSRQPRRRTSWGPFAAECEISTIWRARRPSG